MLHSYDELPSLSLLFIIIVTHFSRFHYNDFSFLSPGSEYGIVASE
jgi:hypothetical protein